MPRAKRSKAQQRSTIRKQFFMSEYSNFVSIAESIAREAGTLLREYYHRGVSAEYKGDVDIVTEADRASEKLIVSRLRSELPAHGVYGEEGARSGLDAEYRWYIDPLDGTTNFAHGFPVFAVVLGCEKRHPRLAAEEDGEIVAGVTYDPLRDEMFSAAKGEGATLNGKPIHVSPTKLLQESLIATGFPSKKRHESPNVHFYQEFTLRSHGVRRAGAAAIDLAYVACGRLEAFWEFKLNPWDTSSGVLLIQEAGGKLTHFDGGKFTLDSREVLATNGLIHGEMVSLFDDLFAGRNLSPIPSAAEFAALRSKLA
jgi:myo-inositol-1(or 4)-monophosphatase